MMKTLRTRFLLLCLCLGLVSCGSPRQELSQEPVENFALIDHQGKFHELYYYSDMSAVVLITQGNGCPIGRLSVPYLRELKEQYESKGVVFLMLNANPQDDRFSIAAEAKEYNINIPILEDRTQVVAEALKVMRTAEALLINPKNWKIVYRGAIHDQLGYETQKKRIKYHYLRDAMDALLAGRPVAAPQTPVQGCIINLENRHQSQVYTYTDDVAPILVKSCVPCHSPGGTAPWTMDNYKKVRGWGPMIREVVRTKRMPPWHADPYYGEFRDDLSLASREARAIVRWVEQGFLRGEGEDPLLKAPRPDFDRWALGEPDLVFTLGEEQKVPATGTLQYYVIEVKEPIKEDLWVRAIDLRPSNTRVVHHSNVTIKLPGETESVEKEKWYTRSGLAVGGYGQVIAGYAPGFRPFVLPEDTGMFIPKGAKITFWMHYITTGKPETDLSKLGLYLHKQKPPRVYSAAQITNKTFRIPAGAKEHPASGSYTFEDDVILSAITPHMHYRGKSMKFTVQYPDGTEEVVLSSPNYNFHWQRRYIFKEPKRLPAGTRLVADGTFDNSAQNPENPDPTKDITFGIQSYDEMFSGFLSYTLEKNQPVK